MSLESGIELETRGYQYEMLEHSRARNTIVAMDTGSGKTAIAVLRIRDELERSTGKRAWFLCPTVALAEQQGNVLRGQLPSFQTRILTGNDDVDSWSEQRIWDAILLNVHIVVSTHQVLVDALTHAFVRLEDISLLIFDEAHHCIGKHPANKIMQTFYHPFARANQGCCPAILGLTASPNPKSKPATLSIVEQNLNALSKTPKINREELLKYVHRPEMVSQVYENAGMMLPPSLSKSLDLYRNMDITKDPYLVHLQAEGAFEKYEQLVLSRKTFCHDHMRGLVSSACDLHNELGPWSAEMYIVDYLKKYKSEKPEYASFVQSVEDEERAYLDGILTLLGLSVPPDAPRLSDEVVSHKVNILLDWLVDLTTPSSAGIVFVKTRAAAYMLSKLLNLHPRTQHILRTGYFVGSSAYENRTKRGELLNINDQKENLNDLRSGTLNLIVATSVCEEGIDISVCNFVICFEPPANVKSFIQRRGRARSQESKFVIMFCRGEQDRLEGWQQVERQMTEAYMDDMRELEELEQLENEEQGYQELFVDSTGAKLTLDNAVSHLFHFTAKLPKAAYTSLDPVFIYDLVDVRFNETNSGQITPVRCRVLLPNSLDESVREAYSRQLWKSERKARNEAAFEAYKKLYHAGLVNEHLLPEPVFDREIAKVFQETTKQRSPVLAAGEYSPWPHLAAGWRSAKRLYTYTIRLSPDLNTSGDMLMLSPALLPKIQAFSLFLNAKTTTVVEILALQDMLADEDVIQRANLVTKLLFSSAFRGRVKDETGFPLVFVPVEAVQDLQNWQSSRKDSYPATVLIKDGYRAADVGLIRDKRGALYEFHGIEDRFPEQNEADETTSPSCALPHLALKRNRKRTDFLHPLPKDQPQKTNRFIYLKPEECEVDRLPLQHAETATMIPCIMHKIRTALVAEACCNNLLPTTAFSSSVSLLPALCASVAREQVDYQRLEFLGDSLLKTMVAITLMTQHRNWHEGYLSAAKDRIVSNARLALAAQQTGLDTYILTQPFTGHKWTPLYNADLQDNQPPPQREISTKTLADVVEAIIGAAFLDGDKTFDKPVRVLQQFLPEIQWSNPVAQAAELFDFSIATATVPQISEVESLLGRCFAKKSLLLEAITHPSHISTPSCPSYQRLEFLGDAILDYIVTTKIFSHPSSKLPVHHMHLLRTATVNAAFLAFCAMRHTTSVDVATTPPAKRDHQGEKVAMEKKSLCLPLFLRTAPVPGLSAALEGTRRRYAALKAHISTALDGAGGGYPWRAFAAFAPEKVYSDVLEAVLGAVFIDSRGDFEACAAVLRRFGVLAWLDGALERGAKVWHPKEELGVVAGNEKVVYESWVAGDDEESEGGVPVTIPVGDGRKREMVLGEGPWKCKVTVGAREVCIENGWFRYEAETAAAEEAVRILRRTTEDDDAAAVEARAQVYDAMRLSRKDADEEKLS